MRIVFLYLSLFFLHFLLLQYHSHVPLNGFDHVCLIRIEALSCLKSIPNQETLQMYSKSSGFNK